MSSNVADLGDNGGLGILDITLKSDKPLKYAKVKILTAVEGGYPLYREERTLDSCQVTFRAPKENPLAPEMILQVEYSRGHKMKKTIIIRGEDLLKVYEPGGVNRPIWKQSYEGIELLVELENPFRPTTERILEVCPRFRILVMGKSGVGKSSLINKVFGITDALVSHSKPGEANIDRELTSERNPQLLLHDSRGFEPGEDDNLQVVQDFIKRREQEPEIKNKLHAIWLCIQAPLSGGRMLETSVEEFLNLKNDGKLGKVPIVVVFTKYDRIVIAARRDLGKGATLEEAVRNANNRFKEECFIPFEAAVGKDIPYLSASIKPDYTNTLNDLIKTTVENVGKYIADAAIVTGISQRINAQVKIRTSIEVGKRRHWKQLISSVDSSITLERFLRIIHQDIVKVWNIEDKSKFLTSCEFEKSLLTIVDNPDQTTTTFKSTILDAVKFAANLLSGPVGPMVEIIRFVASNWINDTFHKTPENLRRVMIYIVNLTIVMQNLFWIQYMRVGASGTVAIPVKSRFIKLALSLYIDASDRKTLLDEIDRHTQGVGSFLISVSKTNHNKAVDEVIALIKRSTITNQDAIAQQIKSKSDESWESEEDDTWVSHQC